MGKTKERGKYQGVSLPADFIKEIKTHILKDSKYKSIAEFIRESCREKMDRDKKPFRSIETEKILKQFEKYADKIIEEKLGSKGLDDWADWKKKQDSTNGVREL